MNDVLLVVVIVVALGFDFTNGFHDTANAVATSVSTRALTPRMAVLVASAANLAGAESLVDLDELIDRANRRVVERILELGGDPAMREYGLRMVVVSRALERIGDHAVDIGEQTAYLLTAEFREFTDASHPTAREA